MTSVQEQRYDERDAEALLGALAGIVSAHIVRDATGRMAEIHVLATSEHHPKQVVRNVESALSAGLGIEVDRRIVSVAQIRTETTNGYRDEPAASVAGTDTAEALAVEPDAGATPDSEQEPEPARLEYVRFSARRDAEQCICDVILRTDREEVTGTGRGPDTKLGRAEAAARAVFDAIGHARPEVRLVLEGAALSSSRGRQYVIVSAHTLLDRETVPLAGAAVVSRSPEEAAILAALQASNRWSA
jgi:hypothetical protein